MDKYKAWQKFVDDFLGVGLRTGQSYMNALYFTDEGHYRAIVGTDIDCFYLDSKCGAFLEALKKHWEV